MNETRALATFLSELTYDTVSPEAIQLTKNVIIDWLGVAIAGAYETPAKLLRHAVMPHDYGAEATVLALPDELENRNTERHHILWILMIYIMRPLFIWQQWWFRLLWQSLKKQELTEKR